MKVLVLIMALSVCATTASACRLALALGLDVSGSVDASEYRLQLNGLSTALLRPAVIESLLATPQTPVEIAVYEWSGPNHQITLVEWHEIKTLADIQRLASDLRMVNRAPANPSTALGTAMQYGAALLRERDHCWALTLDISGDGKSNTGPRPQDVQTSSDFNRITINALVVGGDDLGQADRRQVQIGELQSYYDAYVIRGPGAFVETALGFNEYADSMERKLLRELKSFALSARPIDQ
ncbi:MAG: DUF1194 domain-containing protein [Paracoccaceae bacterium]|nr:DUF1194 domain-containing protein [Paracoccaceae bacterium]